jgi:cytochrome c-type biogenesis protein CcmE|tara:strand:+ start:216 stop:611 length:396 start_codon:yes stop_codon:yes gene_type:complete
MPTGVELMERRVRIVVTLGLIAAMMGLMLINVEPEIDLSVDQLMDSPEEYEGETLRIHGTILILDSNNQTLVMQGENHTVEVDYAGASLPSMATENKTVSIRGELHQNANGWLIHAYEIKTGCPSKYEAEA